MQPSTVAQQVQAAGHDLNALLAQFHALSRRVPLPVDGAPDLLVEPVPRAVIEMWEIKADELRKRLEASERAKEAAIRQCDQETRQAQATLTTAGAELTKTLSRVSRLEQSFSGQVAATRCLQQALNDADAELAARAQEAAQHSRETMEENHALSAELQHTRQLLETERSKNATAHEQLLKLESAHSTTCSQLADARALVGKANEDCARMRIELSCLAKEVHSSGDQAAASAAKAPPPVPTEAVTGDDTLLGFAKFVGRHLPPSSSPPARASETGSKPKPSVQPAPASCLQLSPPASQEVDMEAAMAATQMAATQMAETQVAEAEAADVHMAEAQLAAEARAGERSAPMPSAEPGGVFVASTQAHTNSAADATAAVQRPRPSAPLLPPVQPEAPQRPARRPQMQQSAAPSPMPRLSASPSAVAAPARSNLQAASPAPDAPAGMTVVPATPPEPFPPTVTPVATPPDAVPMAAMPAALPATPPPQTATPVVTPVVTPAVTPVVTPTGDAMPSNPPGSAVAASGSPILSMPIGPGPPRRAAQAQAPAATNAGSGKLAPLRFVVRQSGGSVPSAQPSLLAGGVHQLEPPAAAAAAAQMRSRTPTSQPVLGKNKRVSGCLAPSSSCAPKSLLRAKPPSPPAPARPLQPQAAPSPAAPSPTAASASGAAPGHAQITAADVAKATCYQLDSSAPAGASAAAARKSEPAARSVAGGGTCKTGGELSSPGASLPMSKLRKEVAADEEAEARHPSTTWYRTPVSRVPAAVVDAAEAYGLSDALALLQDSRGPAAGNDGAAAGVASAAWYEQTRPRKGAAAEAGEQTPVAKDQSPAALHQAKRRRTKSSRKHSVASTPKPAPVAPSLDLFA